MKGMIFAAGVGSRLKPWTDFHPKALVEVGGKPAIGRVIDRMKSAGITHIVVNVHHFAAQITEYLRNEYNDAQIDISDESDLLLDTGGGLRKALPLIGDESVLIHNADIVSDMDLRDMIHFHEHNGSDATLLVQPRETSRYFLFDSRSLRGWANIRTGEMRPAGLAGSDRCERLAFGGVHILSPSVYSALSNYAPDGKPFSITDFYIDRCAEMNIEGYRLPPGRSWFDVGKPETLELARTFMKQSSH